MYEYRVLPSSAYEIIDGDTLKSLHLDLGFGVYVKVKARLARIDAPELSAEGMEGEHAKAALGVFLKDKPLTVRVLSLDKYGRALVEMYAAGENVSDWLLVKGYAKAYGTAKA